MKETPTPSPESLYGEKIEQVHRRVSLSSFRAAAEFKRAALRMAPLLSAKEFEIWAELGLQLGAASGRSWDCAAEYFKSSPTVMEIDVFAFIDLHQWVGHGRDLAAISSEAATSYFQHSPIFIRQVDLWSLDKWVQLGRGLLEDHSRSARLASIYFKSSLHCLPVFGLKGLHEWVEVAAMIAVRSQDFAQLFMESSAPWFAPLTDEERTLVLQITRAMAESSYTSLPKLFPLIQHQQRKIKEDVRKPLYQVCLNMSRHSPKDALDYLESCPVILSCAESKDQLHLMEMGVKLSALSWEAALGYITNLPEILASLPVHKVQPWFEAGLEIARENPHAAAAYYAMESRRSQETITRLQRTVHLQDVDRLLNLYAEGLTARKLKIKKLEKGDDASPSILPTTDGEIIHLPEKVARYEDYTRNFKWYKVATAHQAGYYEYGTFQFSIRALKETALHCVPYSLREKVLNSKTNDLEGFFQLFKDPNLSSALFRIIEDGRVDYLLRSSYRGLKRDMLPIMEQIMAERPPLSTITTPMMTALELLLHITTLEQVPQDLAPPLKAIQTFLRAELQRVLTRQASVTDSAVATARVYPLIKKLSEIKGGRDEIIEALARVLEANQGEIDAFIDSLLAEAEAATLPQDGGGDAYPLDILEFRGDTKPEEVQKLMKLRKIKDNIEKLNQQGVPLPLELLKELLKMGAEIEISELDQEALENSTGLFVTNIDGLPELSAVKKMKEMLEEEPEAIEELLYGNMEIDYLQESIYYYDEWDHLINDYRSRWCRLKEVSPGETDSHFVEETLKDNAELVNIIRRQFQLLRPEMFRKVKKLESGEEIDIDAAIEAMIDKKCSLTPSEKVYQRRDKRERDVSALFLLDVSASTDEEVEKNRIPLAHDDPSWQDDKYSSARGWGGPPPPPQKPDAKPKRIIDVEKEALVLMAEALESIGDSYAIFGFSGYGRENVEFFTIKNFNERYTDKIKNRVGAIKPQRSTRMGPAIRHAISKLDKADSRLKLLILLSDGYPQDYDYGKDRTSKEYGIQDTAKALHEAREKNINPFLITVDPAGNDYLKEMCARDDYMVIEKVSSLPQELLRTYRTLTYR